MPKSRYRIRLRIALSLSLFFSVTSLVQAGGSIGIDYAENEITITDPISGRILKLNASGVGFSLGWDISGNWTTQLNHSRYSGDDVQFSSVLFERNLFANLDGSATHFGISYSNQDYWANIGASISRSDQNVRAFAPITGELTRNIDESQRGQGYSLEVGRDWILGNWIPSISFNLNNQSVDIDRTFLVGSEFEVEESLSGTDAGLSASLFYQYELSQKIAFVPSMGLYIQKNVDGEISGTARFSRQTDVNIETRSRSYRDSLGSDEYTNGNILLSLIAGDWVCSAGAIISLDSDIDDKSYLVGLSYSF